MAKGFILCNNNARGTLFKFFFLCRYSLSIEGNKRKEKEGRSLVFFFWVKTPAISTERCTGSSNMLSNYITKICPGLFKGVLCVWICFVVIKT